MENAHSHAASRADIRGVMETYPRNGACAGRPLNLHVRMPRLAMALVRSRVLAAQAASMRREPLQG